MEVGLEVEVEVDVDALGGLVLLEDRGGRPVFVCGVGVGVGVGVDAG